MNAENTCFLLSCLLPNNDHSNAISNQYHRAHQSVLDPTSLHPVTAHTWYACKKSLRYPCRSKVNPKNALQIKQHPEFLVCSRLISQHNEENFSIETRAMFRDYSGRWQSYRFLIVSRSCNDTFLSGFELQCYIVRFAKTCGACTICERKLH